MRIAVFSRSFDQLYGGLEFACQSLCQGLVKEGHEVSVITSRSLNGRAYDKVDGLEIAYASSGKPGRYSRPYFQFAFEEFQRQNAEKKFDVVHAESTAIKFRPQCPLVVRMHGTSLGEIKTARRQGLLKFAKTAVNQSLNYLWVNRVVSSADVAVAISDEMAAYLRVEYSPKRIETIYNGVDTDLFKPEKTEYAHRILYVGRLIPEKGYKRLIDAMPNIRQEVSDAELHIVGGRKRGAEPNGVFFHGTIEHSSLPKVYNSCDIFALPTTREEGMPISILEAMSCGIPVVATRVGGLPTIIDDGVDGFLMDKPDDVCCKTLDLLKYGGMQTLGRNARKKALKKFSQKKMVKKFVKLYEEISYDL